jgi:hypothetical protein
MLRLAVAFLVNTSHLGEEKQARKVQEDGKCSVFQYIIYHKKASA